MKDTIEELKERFDVIKNSLARKMFEEAGYDCVFRTYKPYDLVTIIKEQEVYYMVDTNFKDIECVKQYSSITPELLLAFNQLFKELGWIE